MPNDDITHFLGLSPKGVALESQEVAKQPDNPCQCPPENSTELMGSLTPAKERQSDAATAWWPNAVLSREQLMAEGVSTHLLAGSWGGPH